MPIQVGVKDQQVLLTPQLAGVKLRPFKSQPQTQIILGESLSRHQKIQNQMTTVAGGQVTLEEIKLVAIGDLVRETNQGLEEVTEATEVDLEEIEVVLEVVEEILEATEIMAEQEEVVFEERMTAGNYLEVVVLVSEVIGIIDNPIAGGLRTTQTTSSLKAVTIEKVTQGGVIKTMKEIKIQRT